MKKGKIFLVLISAIVVLFAGCGNRDNPESSQIAISENNRNNGNGSNQIAAGENDRIEAETVTYIDCIGREVEIPENIERIAAIDAFSGELMVMTGAGDQLAACPQGVKSDVLLQEIYPELSEVPVVQSGGSINAEALLELSPDVVLLKYGLYIAEGEAEKLEKMNIPYLVVAYTTMEEQIDAIRLVGQVAGGTAEEKAEQICEYYQNTVELVKEKTNEIPQEEQLHVYHSINQTYRTDGVNSLGADWISAAGGVNCSVGETLLTEGDGYFTNKEQIFVWDPDVIICNDSIAAEYFRNDEEWQGLRAVREEKVYQIPVGATRWGQQGSVETYFGMLWLGATLYPELYQDVDLRLEVCTFYEEVLGIPMDDEMYETILSGTGLRMNSSNAD